MGALHSCSGCVVCLKWGRPRPEVTYTIGALYIFKNGPRPHQTFWWTIGFCLPTNECNIDTKYEWWRLRGKCVRKRNWWGGRGAGLTHRIFTYSYLLFFFPFFFIGEPEKCNTMGNFKLMDRGVGNKKKRNLIQSDAVATKMFRVFYFFYWRV